jgi:hypothetical protein
MKYEVVALTKANTIYLRQYTQHKCNICVYHSIYSISFEYIYIYSSSGGDYIHLKSLPL